MRTGWRPSPGRPASTSSRRYTAPSRGSTTTRPRCSPPTRRSARSRRPRRPWGWPTARRTAGGERLDEGPPMGWRSPSSSATGRSRSTATTRSPTASPTAGRATPAAPAAASTARRRSSTTPRSRRLRRRLTGLRPIRPGRQSVHPQLHLQRVPVSRTDGDALLPPHHAAEAAEFFRHHAGGPGVVGALRDISGGYALPFYTCIAIELTAAVLIMVRGRPSSAPSRGG